MKNFMPVIILLTFAFNSNAQDTTLIKTIEPIREPIEDFSDVEPTFPGGNKEMMVFIQSNMVYPDSARVLNEQGVVYVQFIINTDGSISDATVIRGAGRFIDAEAIRLIKLMPNWIPGTQNGKAVRVRYTLPINFRLM